MRINPIQPGIKTFHRLEIIGIFDKKEIDSQKEDMIQKLKKMKLWGFISSKSLYSLYTWSLNASFLSYNISVRLYADGFHIKIKNHNNNDIGQDLCKYLFDDFNNHSIWTQDYNKIVPIIKEICKELKKYNIKKYYKRK